MLSPDSNHDVQSIRSESEQASTTTCSRVRRATHVQSEHLVMCSSEELTVGERSHEKDQESDFVSECENKAESSIHLINSGSNTHQNAKLLKEDTSVQKTIPALRMFKKAEKT